ncbi:MULTISPECIES: hypothetical protein [Halorhodospira]|uniref:hypothetical protein n=1 Tax=Halorhodospira TaxID=85108 RepID=UPI001EE79CE5|nr:MULTISPECIES: hypothetical protein [Halorhodospira]MCG5528590.1 hypothetical protein [Halorhodospira halophila]MCG5543747.1 hypothetical protein [Halorhodospira sp. 9628]
MTTDTTSASSDLYADALSRASAARSILATIAEAHEGVDRQPMTNEEHGALLAAHVLLCDAERLIAAGQIVQHREGEQ